MLWNTARKALEDFIANSAEQAAVTFYGGEPLLELDLIERCCRFVEELKAKHGKQIRYQLTTNGTLLSTETVARLAKFPMNLLISLDGDAIAHDANRLTCGGAGSHDRIIENIKAMNQIFPDYARTAVGFATTIGSNVSPVAVWKYFDQNIDALNAVTHIVTTVSSKGTNYWSVQPPSRQWQEEMAQLRAIYYRKLVAMDVGRSRFLDGLFLAPFIKLYRRAMYRSFGSRMNLNGCCKPGSRRLFVDIAGTFYSCERTEKYQKIGNCDIGIDDAQVSMLTSIYTDTRTKKCRRCWAQRLCGDCFASLSCSDRGNDPEYVAENCDGTRMMLSNALRDFCFLAEKNPFVWRFIDGIVVS